MFKIISMLCPPLAVCGLALGLTACAAVPVAQMALSSSPAKTPCVSGSSCQTASAGIPASLGKPFQTLFGAPAADPQDGPPPDPK
jgi:hypothetical protein